MNVLAWARQPPGALNHKALARIIDQLNRLRDVGLDPACADSVHPERLRNSLVRAAVSPNSTYDPSRCLAAGRPWLRPCSTP